MALYDTIGRSYAQTRRPDPRIAAAITGALGDVGSVLDVGAGAGSYEPARTVLAVDPSVTMIAQRPVDAAPIVRAAAERLPVRSKSVDAALGVHTVHHWTSLEAGIAELTRVVRQRIVLLTSDPGAFSRFWLIEEYLPAAAATDRAMAIAPARLFDLLPGVVRVSKVLIPHDCVDGFGAAYWRRPERYLDPVVRAGISMLAKTDPALLQPGLGRLAADLESARWQREHADLLALDELDVGYRLVVAQL